MSAILRYAAQRPRIRLANRRERLVEQVGCLGVQPGDAWVRTEPRLLPACVAASGLCGVAAGRHLVQFAVEDGDGLAVADGPAGGGTVAQSLRQERLRLAPEALLPHALDPSVDAFDQDLPLEAQPEHRCRRDELAGGHRRTEGTAGELDDLERPDDAPEVAGKDRSAGLRVETSQPGMERVAADPDGLGLQATADRCVGRRDLERVERGTPVEAGAPHQERTVTPGPDGSDIRAGGELVARDARLLGHVEHVELVVRYAAALRDGQL